MNRLATPARLLLGLVFVVFGLDGVLHFLPLPPMPPPAAAFIGSLVGTRLFYAVKAIEVGSGLLLLSGRFVPLALALLAPVIFNIVWFDAALDPASLAVGGVLVLLEAGLLWHHRAHFAPLFSARRRPVASS